MYSATARAAALLYPGLGMKLIAQRILGDPERSFGGILPNSGTLLLEHIPAVAGYSEDSILAGSAYHLLAPFLEPEECMRLRGSIFVSNGRGHRNWYADEPLRYCSSCAEEDAAAGRPACWRVLPNVPAVACCDVHRRRLIITSARLSRRALHHAEPWFSHTQPGAEEPSYFELYLAEEARWLYQQRSGAIPGPKRLAAAVKRVLLENDRYLHGSGRLAVAILIEDAVALLGSCSPAVRINLQALADMSISRVPASARLQVFSLLAYLAGRRLRDVFTAAASSCVFPPTDRLLEKARRRLTQVRQLHPEAARTELNRVAERAVRIVREKDPKSYAALAPRSRRGGGPATDWAALDEKFATTIRLWAEKPAVKSCTTIRALLALAGIPRRRFEEGRELLVLTRVEAQSALERMERARMVERARARLRQARGSCPSLGRTEFDRLDRHAAEVLRRYDRTFYDSFFSGDPSTARSLPARSGFRCRVLKTTGL